MRSDSRAMCSRVRVLVVPTAMILLPSLRALLMEAAVGSGSAPRFALFAEDTPDSRSLLSKYANLVEPLPRKPYADGGVWVVRPDGYVALVTKNDSWNDVDAYLSRFARGATASAH